MVTISAISFAVSAASKSTRQPIKLSHAQQLVAAALGYKSLAAYQASAEEAESLDSSAHFVLDEMLLSRRAAELGLPHDSGDLMRLLHVAFAERLPGAILHASESELYDFVRQYVEDVVFRDDNVASGMAMTNNDGIDEIYLPFGDVILTELPPLGEAREEEFRGHINMGIDIERPYSGHHIDVLVRLSIERTGRVSIADPECEVIHGALSYDWGDDGDSEKVSLAEALAEELGLDVSEAEELVDAEILAEESDDGLVYGYFANFADYASPRVAEKLMARYGGLDVPLSPFFFERVRSEVS